MNNEPKEWLEWLLKNRDLSGTDLDPSEVDSAWRECSRMFDSFQHVELVVSVAGKLIKNPNIDGRILQRKMEEGSYLAWENPCAELIAMKYPTPEMERGRLIASLRVKAI
jgi:hypothetical protein